MVNKATSRKFIAPRRKGAKKISFILRTWQALGLGGSHLFSDSVIQYSTEKFQICLARLLGAMEEQHQRVRGLV
jgi:hypothetical protein